MSAKSTLLNAASPSRAQILADVKRIVGEVLDVSPDDIEEKNVLENRQWHSSGVRGWSMGRS
jgi:hypothetical protein